MNHAHAIQTNKDGSRTVTVHAPGFMVRARVLDGSKPIIESVEAKDWQEPTEARGTPPPRQSGWVGRVASFLKIMAVTKLQGVVDPIIERYRFATCTGLLIPAWVPLAEWATSVAVRVGAACPYARQNGDGWYCGACGCGKWRLARLDRGKLGHPALECPDGLFTQITISAEAPEDVAHG